jgi:phenol 2-monooxygenase
MVDTVSGLLIKCYRILPDKRRYIIAINLRQGALAVLRPDGYLGFTAELGAAGGEAVAGYLSRFLVSTI